MTGVGGITIMEFEGINIGKGKLYLFMAREWEMSKLIEQDNEVDLKKEYFYKAIPISVIGRDTTSSNL